MYRKGIFFIFFINVISCGYMGDPVAPQFLSPQAVRNLGATISPDNSLILNWNPPTDNKNGDDLEEDRLISYRILRGEIPYDIKSEKLKFIDFKLVGGLKNISYSDEKEVTFEIKNIPLNKRFAFVVVPVLGKLGDKNEENKTLGAVYDYVSFYSESSSSNSGEYRTDIKLDTLNSIYSKPSYFGLS